MSLCGCEGEHAHKKLIVLTGGPGAGKTAVLELARRTFCEHVHILPEAASILFGGGFPRGTNSEQRRSTQRAIYYVQRELERSALADPRGAVVLCDRGTVDGTAYWPGPNELWDEVDASLENELHRYETVIHLRSPGAESGYNHSNPVRTETASEAGAIDATILRAWSPHPHRFVVESAASFLEKAEQALGIIRGELPRCCRERHVPLAS